MQVRLKKGRKKKKNHMDPLQSVINLHKTFHLTRVEHWRRFPTACLKSDESVWVVKMPLDTYTSVFIAAASTGSDMKASMHRQTYRHRQLYGWRQLCESSSSRKRILH